MTVLGKGFRLEKGSTSGEREHACALTHGTKGNVHSQLENEWSLWWAAPNFATLFINRSPLTFSGVPASDWASGWRGDGKGENGGCGTMKHNRTGRNSGPHGPLPPVDVISNDPVPTTITGSPTPLLLLKIRGELTYSYTCKAGRNLPNWPSTTQHNIHNKLELILPLLRQGCASKRKSTHTTAAGCKIRRDESPRGYKHHTRIDKSHSPTGYIHAGLLIISRRMDSIQPANCLGVVEAGG